MEVKKFVGNVKVIHTGKDEGQFQELQKDFMRQNEHLKERCKCISIHIEVNYKREKTIQESQTKQWALS